MPDFICVNTDWPNTYAEICHAAARHGDEVAPRGQPTLELSDLTFRIDPSDEHVALLPTGIGRKVITRIAAVEALQLCLGVELPELSHRVAPALTPFAEEDGRFWGSYGARIGDQLLSCHQKLKDDPGTRQAVISLWDPSLDAWGGHKDHPCTLNLVFSLRADGLNLSVTMRSNDVWLGTPYDVFQFTQLQHTLANMLSVPVASYHHHAVSLHLYARDVDKLDELHKHDGTFIRQPRGFTPPVDATYGQLKMHAASVLWPRTSPTDNERVAQLTESERWYRDVLS